MEKGLGDLGFWIGLGIVLAAMIIAGALKERDREREKQGTLRALLERDSQSTTEILAYLREKDAAKRERGRRETPIALAIGAATISLVFGFIAFVVKPLPPPHFPFSMPGYTPPPQPPESITHVIVAFVIWGVGLALTGLLLFLGLRGNRKNDV